MTITAPSPSDIAATVAALSRVVSGGASLTTAEQASASVFLAAVGQIVSVDPHMVNRVQQAALGVLLRSQ